jgi:hypothetical protein
MWVNRSVPQTPKARYDTPQKLFDVEERGGTGQMLGGREAVYRTELDGGPDAKKKESMYVRK